MKIITFANQKGGVGKSTIALQLGYYLKKKNKKICFVDLDNNQLVLNRLKDVNQIDTFRSLNNVKCENYDYCIIDTAPYITEDYSQIFKKSNLIIVPFMIALPDYIGITKIMLEVKNLKDKTLLVPNKVKGRIGHTKIQILKEIESFNIEISNVYIKDYAMYSDTFLEKNGIFSLENSSKYKTQIANFTNFADLVLDKLKN